MKLEELEMFWFFWLQFCQAYDSVEDPDFWYSLDHKLSYNSDYKSDSIASENHPLNWEKKLLNVIDKIKRGPWLTIIVNRDSRAKFNPILWGILRVACILHAILIFQALSSCLDSQPT